VSAEPPIGWVTLLITDIERSTGLWEQAGDRFAALLGQHDALLREAAQVHGGYEVKHTGDGLIFSFGNAGEALGFALQAQLALARHEWPDDVGAIRSRMGIHCGEAIVAIDREGRADFLGPTVNRTARVAQAGHGGQVLVSSAARDEASGHLPEGARLISLGSHRLRGLSDREQLFQLAHPDLPQVEFPALRTLDAHPHNLPVALSSFVGRDEETASLLALLADPGVRLVTLLGPGGTGKTRLSLEVAAAAVESFADGVWFVDLAHATAPEQVAPAIADALRLTVDPQFDVLEQLLGLIETKELLLVLDNFEQAVPGALVVRQLLQRAPRVKVVVTSRIVLRLEGEQVLEVVPLAVPDEAAPLDQIVRSDSVVLFAARAQAVKHDFRVTPENAPTIARICARVAGIPLGVELAASRVRALALDQVLRQLTRGLDILLLRRPDLPARHQSMRAAIQWSHDLLSPEQQQLWAQLSVFVGSFTLEAAERVCDPPAFVDDVLELCDHSLLVVRPAGDETRYAMLEPLREYARGLLEAGTAGALAQRHAACFLGFLTERDAQRDTPGERAAFDAIAADLANIRAAMDHACAPGDDELCARLARRLFRFLGRRGWWDERLARTERGLAAARRLLACAAHEGPRAPTRAPDLEALTAALEYNLADALQDAGRTTEAVEAARQACARARDCGDAVIVARCTNLRGMLALDAQRLDEAAAAFAEALRLWEEAGDEAGRVLALHNLALVAHLRGELGEAKRLYEEALPLRERLGHARGAAEVLNNLGVIAEETGDLPEAWRLYLRTLELHRTLRDPLGMAVAINNLGEVAERQGRLDEAAELASAALSTFRKLGSPHAQHAQDVLERVRAAAPDGGQATARQPVEVEALAEALLSAT